MESIRKPERFYPDAHYTDSSRQYLHSLSSTDRLLVVLAKCLKPDQVFLPPRQEEIYNIIRDHRTLSFDMIRRRFLCVPERTLRYDLKKLLDRDLIEKTGETRGRYYRFKSK